jgi:hypothetical protein
MTKFEFTIQPKKSILDSIECYEPINIDYLDKLIHSDLLKSNFNNPFASEKYNNERQQLIAYRKLYDFKSKMCKVKYEKVKKPNKNKKSKEIEEKEYIPYGRVNPQNALGLHNLRREIRHTLCKDYLVDIDIVCAHPSILLQLCNMYDIDSDRLQEYVFNRQEKLNEIMTIYKCSKDDAKTLFIILLYYGSFNKWISSRKIDNSDDDIKPTKFCEKFKKELGEIGKYIIEQNKDVLDFVEQRKGQEKDYNQIGSVVSYYLQEIECRILETIYKYCIKNKYIIDNVCVLCADGIMIEKDKYKPSLLNEFSQIIKDKFGFDLKFTVKDMTQDYINILDKHTLTDEKYELELLDGYDTKIIHNKTKKFDVYQLTKYFNEDIKELGLNNYKEYFHLTKSFRYFNNYHCFFYENATVYKIFNTEINGYKKFNETFNDLVARDSDDKFVFNFTKLYDECQYKIKYSKFTFEPNKKEKDDEYNLFTGFIYDDDNNDYNKEIVDIYLNHLKYICNNDEKAYNYFENWLAHIIQKPQEKTNVAIVFYSIIEGVGKNLIFDIYAELLKGYTTTFRDTEALTDRFNGDMMGKLFVLGDEINARAQEVANELKNIITRQKEIIEFKGKDKYQVSDYKNYAFTTNNENVFKVSNSDRRYVFIECPEEKKDSEYYNKLVDFKNSSSCLKQLFNYLKNKDLKNFNPCEIPLTDYKKRLIWANLEAYIKFIYEEFEQINNIPLTTNELYKMSIDYAKNNKMKSTYTEDLFNKQFKKVFSDFNKLDKQTRRSIYLFKDIEKNKIKEHIMNKLF